MLITKEQIEKACDLLPNELNNAMQNGGWADKYETVQFVGMTEYGKFAYKVHGWNNIEGVPVTGTVYIEFAREKNLAQGLYLKGDF